MVVDAKCKRCRRAGEKLFLKGERCYTPKCAMVRKPYPPGVHGRSRRRGGLSEFGTQLREKQKVRFLYGVSEGQFERYVNEALEAHGDAVTRVVELVELRLDNVVFRLGFAVSRSIAKQLISHGHIRVDGKRVSIPSYRVHVGQIISIDEGSKQKGIFSNLEITIKKQTTPVWLSLDAQNWSGTVQSLPVNEDVVRLYNIKSIIEYYSR